MNQPDIKSAISKDLIPLYRDKVLELNDYLAENPEISGCEVNSAEKIVSLLQDNGFAVEYPVVGVAHSFIASINKHKERKAAILVEYDALPGIGHACGHCASGAISLLAFLVLNDLKGSIDAQIDIIGTPDEEVMGGKIIMAEKDVFDSYDFAIMIHMANVNAAYTRFLSLDGLEIKYTGKASHAAAAPWEGRNAMNGIQLLYHSIDMMRQHVEPETRIHGYIKEAGKAPNIVPDLAVTEIYTRGPHRKKLDDVTSWVKDCAKAAGVATRTQVEIRKLCPSLKDLTPNLTAEKVLTELYRDLNLELIENDAAIGSSDIGDVGTRCPTFHPLISISEKHHQHTPEFAKAMTKPKTHNAIINGAEIIARFIYTMYTESGLLAKMKKDHRES